MGTILNVNLQCMYYQKIVKYLNRNNISFKLQSYVINSIIFLTLGTYVITYNV